MQINLDKKSGLLLGIIAGLLVVIIVLLVDKVGDDDHFVESQSSQLQIGN
jgi:cell division protein FtsN